MRLHVGESWRQLVSGRSVSGAYHGYAASTGAVFDRAATMTAAAGRSAQRRGQDAQRRLAAWGWAHV